jgi:uncharacterized protein (TIGR02145 family)
MYLGMSRADTDNKEIRGVIKNIGGKLKSTFDWHEGGNGFNSSGFSGLPGGSSLGLVIAFYDLGGSGYWWSSTEEDSLFALSRSLYYDGSDVGREGFVKGFGLSCRCIRN